MKSCLIYFVSQSFESAAGLKTDYFLVQNFCRCSWWVIFPCHACSAKRIQIWQEMLRVVSTGGWFANPKRVYHILQHHFSSWIILWPNFWSWKSPAICQSCQVWIKISPCITWYPRCTGGVVRKPPGGQNWVFTTRQADEKTTPSFWKGWARVPDRMLEDVIKLEVGCLKLWKKNYNVYSSHFGCF